MEQRLQRMELNFEVRLLELAGSFKTTRASATKDETEPQAAQATLETAPNTVGEKNSGESLDRSHDAPDEKARTDGISPMVDDMAFEVK